MRNLKTKLFLVIFSLLFLYNYNFSSTENPHGDIKWNCENCHTAEGWKKLKDPLGFSHKETGFPLSGSHDVANCIGCHTELQFSHTGISETEFQMAESGICIRILIWI